jgi:predicted enzyme related to lactoylglutathione lyase
VDLTVEAAGLARDFWQAVAGFDEAPGSDKGGYEDYTLTNDGHAVAGVCHARGGNAGLPPVWLVYFAVESLEEALSEVEARGGAVLQKRKNLAVVRDPTGAIAALIEG